MQNNQNNDNAVTDYQGLADLMMGQFEKVYDKLAEVNQKLDQKADKSDLALKADKSDIDAVLNRVNLLGNKIDDYRADQISLERQVEKHEKWHFKTAAKIGIKLLPD